MVFFKVKFCHFTAKKNHNLIWYCIHVYCKVIVGYSKIYPIYPQCFYQVHSEVEWDFWFVNFLWWNPVQKQEFCIPLHFLGIKDLKKIEKGQRNFWRPHQRPDREKSWIFIIFSPNYNQLVLIIWAIPLVWPSRP